MFSIIFLYIIIYINTSGNVLYYKSTNLIFLIEKESTYKLYVLLYHIHMMML